MQQRRNGAEHDAGARSVKPRTASIGSGSPSASDYLPHGTYIPVPVSTASNWRLLRSARQRVWVAVLNMFTGGRARRMGVFARDHALHLGLDSSCSSWRPIGGRPRQ